MSVNKRKSDSKQEINNLKQIKKSENRYRSLFNHSAVALCEMDWSEAKKYLSNNFLDIPTGGLIS